MNVTSGRLSFVGLFLFGLWVVVYAADMLTLVKEQSRIDFVGTKPGGLHRGGFKRFTVDAAADWGDLSKSSFKIDIDATSLWSDNNGLTNHLKNSDFFDVPRYPNITFETFRIELRSVNKAVVNGTLTMLGKAVEVAIPCNVEVTDGGLKAECEFKIDRTQWGMTHAKGRVDDEVEIAARFVFGR
ncbi:MAG: YceI family protein [Burkholderiales bacterium]